MTRAEEGRLSGELAEIAFTDLRQQFDQALFDGFVKLYNEAFTDPTEREDPSEWPSRLRSNSGTRLHIVTASRRDDPTDTVGGLALDYFPESACGLFSYVVVDRSARRRGIAGDLFRRGRRALEEEAAAAGRELQAVFAETEDPSLVPPDRSAIPPNLRLEALSRLGARWIDLPYVQPEIAAGAGRCRHLLLLAFPLRDEAALRGETVLNFLKEFYTTTGVGRLESDHDFQAMRRGIGPEVPLHDLMVKRTDG
jgi:hypothetical protein